MEFALYKQFPSIINNPLTLFNLSACGLDIRSISGLPGLGENNEESVNIVFDSNMFWFKFPYLLCVNRISKFL